MDIWKYSTQFSCDMKEMKPIDVGDVGEAVEGPPIRCRNEDIVVTRIAKVRTEAAESCLRNTARWIRRITYIAFKAGFIERGAGDQTFTDQSNSRICGPQSGRCKSEHSNNSTQDTSHHTAPFS